MHGGGGKGMRAWAKGGAERLPLTVPVCVRVDCVPVSGARLAHGQVVAQHGAERHAAGGRGRPDEAAIHVRDGGGRVTGGGTEGREWSVAREREDQREWGVMVLPLLLLLPPLLRPVCSGAGG